LGILIAVAVIVTWSGIFFWLDYGEYPPQPTHLWPNFQRSQGKLFAVLVRYRFTFFILISGALIWGGIQLFHLTIEPYPIQQLPASTTIKKADLLVNEDFYGTVPFFIEIDTGEKNGILKKDTLIKMDEMHREMSEENVGYAFSVLSVLKRMNYYFMGSEESLLGSTEFDDFYDSLIEQYLLYYSSSVDPLEYESLLDTSYRVFSIKGLIYYHNYKDLLKFSGLISKMESELPAEWSLSLHGMITQLENEQNNLRKNWIFSFLGGSLLIFFTVFLFYRKLNLALLSLLPGIISMVISFGFISMAGISIDAFSIIFVAIITGLVIDYSIHTLVALDQIKEVPSLEEGFSRIIGYSGIPIFLSFLTSLLSFSVLFLSSFSGARNLGFLLLASLILSFFLSLYLIPLIILPIHIKNGVKK
jgi:predicted RND superfamily exporter protein